MKQIEFLSIRFTQAIEPWELPAFRGAVIEKVGWENDLFHNHDVENGGFHNRYPLVQYKRVQSKPALLCLQAGAEEFHKLFQGPDREILMAGKSFSLEIEDFRMRTFNVGIWDKEFDYRIWDWIALNQENFKKYHELKSLADRIALLEKILTGHLMAFLEGVDCPTEKRVEVAITRLRHKGTIRVKGVPLVGFGVDFRTNVSIPNNFGLGKCVRLGNGNVRRLRPRFSQPNHQQIERYAKV